MAEEMRGRVFGGKGRVAKVDGGYFGGYIKPANQKEYRRDRRLARNQNGKRKVVVIIRERGGNSVPAVFGSESQAASFIRARIAKGTKVHADESGAWDNLHERFEMKRINHQEAYSLDGACTNYAEEYFSRLRRAKIGIHHHIAGAYLLRYAQESSWSEDTRAVNKSTASRALSLKRGKSVDFGGYWQRIRNKFMPEQKLHTHEEVFKDHVAGQYDESIYRFRVPGGSIYTHTIIRFGSVDKNYIADTFVPDSK